MFDQLRQALCEITGFKAVCLQPNAGSQGEYAGLMVVREYFRSKVCLLSHLSLISFTFTFTFTLCSFVD